MTIDNLAHWIGMAVIIVSSVVSTVGLVHDIKFRAIEVVEGDTKGEFGYVDLDPEKYRVEIQVRRNNRATGQMRRRMK